MTPFGQPAAFRLAVAVETPLPLDESSGGPIRLVRIVGGHVTGRLTGTILPGGTDWQRQRENGSLSIDARYLIELDDGARVEVQCCGLRGPHAAGFWSSLSFRTVAPEHSWLNDEQFLGSGRKGTDAVTIDVFRLPEPD